MTMLHEGVSFQGLICTGVAIYFVISLVQGQVLESGISVNTLGQSCFLIDS